MPVILLLRRSFAFDFHRLVLRRLRGTLRWILRGTLHRRTVIWTRDHMAGRGSTMHEHWLVLRSWRREISASMIPRLWSRPICVMVVRIGVSFRRSLTVHWGRSIVIHRTISLTVTRIIGTSLMLEKHLSALLGGRASRDGIASFGTWMDAEIGSSHQVWPDVEFRQSRVVRGCREATQHHIVDSIVGNQMMN